MLSKFVAQNSYNINMKKYFLSLLFILVLFSLKAQEIEDNENGTWVTVVNNFKITEKISVVSIVQWRFVEKWDYTRVFLVLPFINYKFNDKISAGVGYNFSNYSFVGIKPPGLDYEHRIWQHVSLFSNLGKVKMNQRFMFEERIKTNLSNENTYSNRFRYRINFDFNLFKFKNNKYLLGHVSEELRIRFSGGGVSDPTFDQNNFVAAVGYKLLPNSKIFMGYGRNYYNAGNGVCWGDHTLHTVLSYNFDFTKKKFYK